MYTYIITQWFCRYIFGKFVAGRDLTMFSNYFLKNPMKLKILSTQEGCGAWLMNRASRRQRKNVRTRERLSVRGVGGAVCFPSVRRAVKGFTYTNNLNFVFSEEELGPYDTEKRTVFRCSEEQTCVIGTSIN